MRAGSLAALLVVLALASCGGTSSGTGAQGSTPESASFVPVADAQAFYLLDTDAGDAQWQALGALLHRFGGMGPLLGKLQNALGGDGDSLDGITTALGPELGMGGTAAGAVLATQPRDAVQLSQLVASLNRAHPDSAVLTRTIDGWTVGSDSRAGLDAAARAHAGRSLADQADFRALMAELPDDALARVFYRSPGLPDPASVMIPTLTVPATTVPLDKLPEHSTNYGGMTTTEFHSSGLDKPVTLRKSITAMALTARDDGLELRMISRSARPPAGSDFAPDLASVVPADAIAFVSFDRDTAPLLEHNPLFSLALFGPLLGLRLDEHPSLSDLTPFITGESALYVRQGAGIPEVTLVLDEDDVARRLAKLDAVAAGFAKVEPVTVDGVAAKRVTVRGGPVYYAALDGRLVVTDSIAGLRGLKEGGSKLADDSGFRDAMSAAGVPDRVGGLVYVDVGAAAPLMDGLASLSHDPLPAWLQPNLKPVRTLVAYTARHDDETRSTVFLQVK